MSSTVAGTLSAGAQLLANEKLSLPGTSQPGAGSTPLDQQVKKTAATAPLQAGSVISGSITSPDGDTVELSAEAMQMLQQMGDAAHPAPIPSYAAHSFSAVPAYESFDLFG